MLCQIREWALSSVSFNKITFAQIRSIPDSNFIGRKRDVAVRNVVDTVTCVRLIFVLSFLVQLPSPLRPFILF